MNNSLTTYQQALENLEALSRFWLFKRKNLATEVQAHLRDVQNQLDTLSHEYQQQSILCAKQHNEINELKSRNDFLAEALANKQSELKEQLLHQEQSVGLLKQQIEKNQILLQRQENEYTHINQHYLSLNEKFSLVSKILALQPPENEKLTTLYNLINHDYMEFANRESSLAGEAQAVLDMQSILSEMQMLNNFPSIAGKTILSIAGGFSSGKSAFLNSFIRNQNVQLATGINPVTVIPSYLVHSDETRIKAYSYNGGAIDLEPSLYASLSHEYVQTFGFDLRRILPFISVKASLDPDLFDNLCIIDTPGYNPGASGVAAASDRSTASSLINQASAMIWVIGLDANGTISQSDLDFIESSPFRGESLYIVLNKADLKSKDDLLDIIEQVSNELNFSGIEYAGICAYSSLSQKEYPFSGLMLEEFLGLINCKVDVVDKIYNKIDAVFNAYNQAIQADINLLKKRVDEINAIKLDALEMGGTALLDLLYQKFPNADLIFDPSELKEILEECEQLRRNLKLAVKNILT